MPYGVFGVNCFISSFTLGHNFPFYMGFKGGKGIAGLMRLAAAKLIQPLIRDRTVPARALHPAVLHPVVREAEVHPAAFRTHGVFQCGQQDLNLHIRVKTSGSYGTEGVCGGAAHPASPEDDQLLSVRKGGCRSPGRGKLQAYQADKERTWRVQFLHVPGRLCGECFFGRGTSGSEWNELSRPGRRECQQCPDCYGNAGGFPGEWALKRRGLPAKAGGGSVPGCRRKDSGTALWGFLPFLCCAQIRLKKHLDVVDAVFQHCDTLQTKAESKSAVFLEPLAETS